MTKPLEITGEQAVMAKLGQKISDLTLLNAGLEVDLQIANQQIKLLAKRVNELEEKYEVEKKEETL